MNKIFATAASVLVLGMASSAMAQSSSSGVSQTGYDNDAIIDQIGTGAVNSSSVSQNNGYGWLNGNSATVIQNGTSTLENTSGITQIGAQNTAEVKQGGDGAEPGNDHNTSGIGQSGIANKATVKQGDLARYNESGISQNGSNNEAKVEQGGDLGVNDGPNLSSIGQTGDSHYAEVFQGGDSINTSGIVQDNGGTSGDNWASVTQKGTSGVVNNSSVYQSGYQNTVTVNQH